MTDANTLSRQAAANPLLRDIRRMRGDFIALPTHDVVDGTKYPNKLQQKALLTRAFEALTMAEWALEEYMGKGNQ